MILAVIQIVAAGPWLARNTLLVVPIWGFPKIRGTFLGVPIIRIIVFWGLYWGLPILGNYHITHDISFHVLFHSFIPN